MPCRRGIRLLKRVLSARPTCRGKKKAMSPQVMRKLADAPMCTSFWVHSTRPQARMTSAAPVPMGAANSPSATAREFRFRMPPLRRVSSMVLLTGTAEASHRGSGV